MKIVNVRFFLIGMAMFIAAGLAFAMKPTKLANDELPHVDLETMIPKEFAGWKSESLDNVQIQSPEVKANLDKTYDQILSRIYGNTAGDKIMLTITYGSRQNQNQRAHRQEVCYKAQGFTINSLSRGNLFENSNIEVTRFLAVMEPRNEPVTYWFTMGDAVVSSYLSRFWVQLKYSLSGVIPDGFLVRISSLADNPDRAYQLQADFAKALLAAVKKEDVWRLGGRNS